MGFTVSNPHTREMRKIMHGIFDAHVSENENMRPIMRVKPHDIREHHTPKDEI